MLARKMLFWLMLAAVTVLSLLPVDQLPAVVFDLWDKAQHALAFLALTLLGRAAFERTHSSAAWALPAGLLLHGALIELAQNASGWRQGDALDWLADSVGVGAGLGVWWALRRSRTAAL